MAKKKTLNHIKNAKKSGWFLQNIKLKLKKKDNIELIFNSRNIERKGSVIYARGVYEKQLKKKGTKEGGMS